ncbi:hypothetical protein N1851_029028 [Merluccius polli]|uniref:Uncharacterized protein n=1 Tax=Merluccius polli TaxID=89951 RepID=A0AA47NT01_MERPO|nr:hypothetical protein N1851_029028 [Merluccius polli]
MPFPHSHAIFVVTINSPQKGNNFNTSFSILKIRRLHKYRKHSGTVNVFKPGINSVEQSVIVPVLPAIFQMGKKISQYAVVDELLQELNYLIGSLSLPITLIASALCKTNPVKKTIGDKGPLTSAWKRKAYYKNHFNQILDCQTILDQTGNLNTVDKQPQRTSVHIYKSFFDGAFFKENELLSNQESISLILYIDEFEICNPLGTSKRKHTICGCNSALSSIYLAALIKSNDLKCYGYDKVLEPVIDDLVILEQSGIFVTKLGRTVKDSGVSIPDSNREGSFHADHLRILEENKLPNYYGVKSNCVLSKHLSYFDISTGFPPDIMHNCIHQKKYFTLFKLNEAISSLNFKCTDKTNRPHPVALSFVSKKTVGGNAHENWSLIRYLPLLIGWRVPCEEPAWQILTDLKDIVDLVVSPVHTEDSIAYLDLKISEQRIRFQEVFPDCNLKLKHHFLEHYPYLIRQYGPLVGWTMRYEAKHSFFKRVARNIRCFKNVLLSLSERHQYQIAHHLHACSFTRP